MPAMSFISLFVIYLKTFVNIIQDPNIPVGC